MLSSDLKGGPVMKFYKSNVLGMANNTRYPHEYEVNQSTSEDKIRQIFNKDYVCAQYKNDHRSREDFIVSDCMALDCDNDHSDDPNSWIKPEHLINEFDNVFMIFHMSRHNMLPKDGKTARPKFHVFMWMKPIKDEKAYSELKKKINSIWPFFDDCAEDSARFFYGTEKPEIIVVPGNLTINEYVDAYEKFANMDAEDEEIPCGKRNSTLSKFAAVILKRYGDTPETEKMFYDKNYNCCTCPLDDDEMETIWKSALTFYKTKVLTNPNYVPPEEYNDNGKSYVPTDRSDTGQALKLVEHYGDVLAHNISMHFMVYKDNRWNESEELALELVHRFTNSQLMEALRLYKQAEDSGASKPELDDAKAYIKFVVQRRNSNYISATLKQTTPYITVPTDRFDEDPFLLSTPEGVYDLRKGLDTPKPHDPKDYITKMTACNPTLEGKELWEETLNKIFSNNKELISYVQQVCGLAAIGAVYQEIMIIAHGDGGNGKSTFWNTILKVFGDYGGTLSSDNLFVNNRNSSRFAKAFLKGRRLIISSESELGARLNDGMVKQLCSTDRIKGEKKFKDEFDFTPSHTLVLYTNHLPKVAAGDDGFWRRVRVIPFLNKFTGKDDTKNFSEVLYEKCKGYILNWVIQGAKIVYDNKFHIDVPKVVLEACNQYKNDNDWLQQFINECCTKEVDAKIGSNALYQTYVTFSRSRNEYPRSAADFKRAMDAAGFVSTHPHNKVVYHGITLLPEYEDDFLA